MFDVTRMNTVTVSGRPVLFTCRVNQDQLEAKDHPDAVALMDRRCVTSFPVPPSVIQQIKEKY